MNFSIDIKKCLPKIIFVFAFLIMLFSNCAFGQKVTIEDVIQKDQKVYVYYTLEGNSVYEVILYYLLVDGNEGWRRAINLRGDFGTNQKGSSKTKLIIWDVIPDKGELVGKFDFKVKATDTKAQKQNQKKQNQIQKKSSLYYPKTSLHYSCNPTRSPFGMSLLIPFEDAQKLGLYIDLKTDFRIYAPGEWALRDRSWITGTMDGVDSGLDETSGGGTDLTACLSIQLSGKKRKSPNIFLGFTVANTPVFDRFNVTYTGPYYAKSHSNNEFYFTAGYLIQTYSGFTYGFTLGIIQGYPRVVRDSLTLFIGGAF